jgi:hypothetical protein
VFFRSLNTSSDTHQVFVSGKFNTKFFIQWFPMNSVKYIFPLLMYNF